MVDPRPDHDLFASVAPSTRSPIVWPGDAELAVCLSILAGYWELEPPQGSVVDQRMRLGFESLQPDYWTYSIRDYGNRVGIFRVFEVLQRYGLTATLAVDAELCRRHSRIVEIASVHGYEIAAQGVAATRLHSSTMSSDEEAAAIEDSRNAIVAVTGASPSGWYGPGRGESIATPQLVAAAGFEYLSDWPNDDAPYLMATDPPILSLPRPVEFDDAEVIVARRRTPDAFPAAVVAAKDQFLKEPSSIGRVLHVSIHSWVMGQPHHIRYLEEVLAALRDSPNVWIATAAAVSARASAALRI